MGLGRRGALTAPASPSSGLDVGAAGRCDEGDFGLRREVAQLDGHGRRVAAAPHPADAADEHLDVLGDQRRAALAAKARRGVGELGRGLLAGVEEARLDVDGDPQIGAQLLEVGSSDVDVGVRSPLGAKLDRHLILERPRDDGVPLTGARGEQGGCSRDRAGVVRIVGTARGAEKEQEDRGSHRPSAAVGLWAG